MIVAVSLVAASLAQAQLTGSVSFSLQQEDLMAVAVSPNPANNVSGGGDANDVFGVTGAFGDPFVVTPFDTQSFILRYVYNKTVTPDGLTDRLFFRPAGITLTPAVTGQALNALTGVTVTVTPQAASLENDRCNVNVLTAANFTSDPPNPDARGTWSYLLTSSAGTAAGATAIVVNAPAGGGGELWNRARDLIGPATGIAALGTANSTYVAVSDALFGAGNNAPGNAATGAIRGAVCGSTAETGITYDVAFARTVGDTGLVPAGTWPVQLTATIVEVPQWLPTPANADPNEGAGTLPLP